MNSINSTNSIITNKQCKRPDSNHYSVSTTIPSKKYLSACCLNANSLRARGDEIRHSIDTQGPFQVICITESWLSLDVPDSVVSLQGYKIIRNDRNTHGGGVAMYILESIPTQIITNSVQNWKGKPGVIEYLMCELEIAGYDPIFMAVIYRPPNAPFGDFSNILGNNMKGYTHKIITSDFNADQLSFSGDANYVRSLIKDNSLQLIQHGVTHSTANSSTWLDLWMVDSMDNIISYSKSASPIAAGHHSISFMMSLQIITTQAKTIESRPLDKLTSTAGQQLFHSLNWDGTVQDNAHLDMNINKFSTSFIEKIDDRVPVKLITVNIRKYAPWMTENLNTETKKVQALYRKFQRSRNPLHLVSYQEARVLLRSAVTSARVTYHNTKITGLDNGAIWTELKQLGLIGVMVQAPLTISIEELNIYVTSHSTTTQPNSNNTQVNDYPLIQQHHQFSLQVTTSEIVSNTIKSIKSNAAGLDSISKKMIVHTLPSVLQSITRIFNQSIQQSIFPEDWKKALIVPVRKIMTPTHARHYRQIAILSFPSKALERIVYNQTIEYLEQHHLLDEYQSGFKKGHSTQTALLKIVNDVRAAMDIRHVTVLILFDFSKAFDKVSHPLLLHKMRILGFTDSTLG